MQMKRLRQFREAAGLTREELAVLAGISWATVRDYERNVNRNPTQQTAQRLADALKVPLAALFFDTATGLPIEKSAA